MRIRGAASAATLAAVAVLASGCAGSGAVDRPTQPATAASPSPTPSASAARSPAPGIGVLGRFRTAQRWLRFTEPAHTGPTGVRLGPRTLRIQLWYPLARAAAKAGRPAAGPLPLIAFGPGFMQCGQPYSRLLRAWASAGYVVEVVNFPLSDCYAAAPTEADMVNQPADMSYAITRLLHLRPAGRGPLHALRLNPHQIGVAGQSDGGDTVAAVGASACCADHQVAAVAVLSGARWPAFPGAYFAAKPVPMLFTQGSADTVNLPGCSIALYHADPARERYYLDLFGADHTTPYWGSNSFERVVAGVSVAFFDRYVLGVATARRAMRRLGDVAGTSALFSHGGGHLPPGPCVT